MLHQPPVLSIVAPVYDEEVLLPEFYRRVVAAIEPLNVSFEIVLVNDGSHDRSGAIMDELHAQDKRVKVIHFSRNFGHQIAITAGTDHATGQAVAVIDSDLQDPPEVIVDMYHKWREGYQVVYGVRSEREGETAFKRATASAFYRLIRRITNINLPLDTGDFRLMDERVVAVMRSMREHHRFMRGLSVWVGFKQAGVSYRRDARKAGVTKYPLKKMLRFALDAITSFSYLPLQLATYSGFVIAGCSVVAILVAIILRLTGNGIAGQATTLVSVLFLGGIQLIFLGIIGEYLGRIYDEVKRRPLYIVATRHGLEAPRFE
ncbi:MAG: glycosyltransferase family 2 protein [Roseiflexaceae bacterium]|jgi:glycosyltransferase involved in cell wall biosynthesis|nr:glycosyltransferase family 2 protein [Chloroflexaceae bacterium]